MNLDELQMQVMWNNQLIVMILGVITVMFIIKMWLIGVVYRSQRRTEDTLVLAKEWFQMGRDQHSDAKEIMHTVQQQTDRMSENAHTVTKKTEEVKAAVEKVPDAVVEKLQGGSGIVKKSDIL